MSTIAIVFAVGGGAAYAANTVFSTDIVNGEVKTPDLAAAAVSSAKIQNAAVIAADLAAGSVNGAKVVNDSLSGADVNESTLEGVFSPMPGKGATATQDSFTVGECSSGCFTFLANPSNGAPFLDGAFKLESCTDGGLMLNYHNQSSSTQVLRQVRYSETGSFVTRSTFPAGTENNFFFTLADEMRRVEAFVEGGGVGEASYDIYTEHQNSPNPDLSDTCTASGSVTSVFTD